MSRPPRTPVVATVVESRRITPGMVRLTVEAEALREFPVGEFTDHYVKLQFPPPGAPYAIPFDPAEVSRTLPRELHHRQRTFTVRDFDPDRGHLTIDFVVHGGQGVAGPWAAAARAGDLLQLVGPGGAYTPDPEAAWHLLVGDEAVIPAIAVSLGRIPAGRRVHVLIEIADEDEKQPLSTQGELQLEWFIRPDQSESAGDTLLDAVKRLVPPPGPGQGFVHGEAGMVMEVRRHLLRDREIAPARLSATGYWKRRRTEEGWRQDKPEWKRRAELDLKGD